MQICKLFESQTIDIPKVDDLLATVRNSANLASLTETRELTVREREALAVLATDVKSFADVTTDTNLTPVLEEFIKSSVSIFLDRYNKVQDKMLNTLNSSSSPERFAGIYREINEELKVQMTIVNEILKSIEKADKMKHIESIKISKSS